MRENKKYLIFILSFMLTFSVTAQASEYVVPSGKTVGIKMYSDGIEVINISEFTDCDGKTVCPAQEAGIKTGDIIKSVNGTEIKSCEDFGEKLDGSELNIEVSDGNNASIINVRPVLGMDGAYHLGVWVRDSAAGIGTITCYDAQTLEFRALGHAVTDVDTGNIMTVESGNIQGCTITGVTKSGVGAPGYISAEFLSETQGTIETNSENGITGVLNAPLSGTDAVETAAIEEVCNGDVEIMTDVCGETEKYSAKVKVISKTGTRNMIIEVTDERLIEKTGGIVQGMSGAPVLQNGKLIGAITHVFVNEPKKGYCICADNLTG